MIHKTLFVLVSMFVAAALFGGGAGGCNTDEVAGHGDDDDVVGTEQDAKDTALAAENIAFRSFTAAFGSPGALVTQEQSALILEKIKSAITTSTRSSCPAGTVVDPSGADVTINGSVTGSCASLYEGDASDGTVRANCTDYNDGTNSGEATVDGLIGVVGSASTVGSESTFSFSTITSNLLILTLANGNNCSAVANVTADVVIDNTAGSGSFEMGGCVAICGEAYDVTGSDTF